MKILVALALLFAPGILYSQTPDLSGFSFALDAGHGGSASGAVNPNGIREKEINLAVAIHLRDFLLAAGSDKVVMTRTTDIGLSLGDREQIANNANVDWFHSVHHNAGSEGDHTSDGSLVLYSETSSGSVNPGQTDVLSDLMALLLSKAFNIRNIGGIGDFTFYGQASFLGVLNDLIMPGQLSEAFFISSYTEGARVKNDDYLKTEAEVLYLSFLQQLNSQLPATGTAVGIVVDSSSNLAGVNVVVTDLLEGRTTLVDSLGNGFYRLDSLSPGLHTLEFASNLDTIQVEVNVESGKVKHFRVKMDTEVKPPFIKPSIPDIKSVIRDGSEVVINWFLNGDETIEEYRILMSTDGINWSVNKDLPATVSEHRLTGLPLGVPIYISITAKATDLEVVRTDRSDSYGIMTGDSIPPVLIVDGFHRIASWSKPSHDFSLLHGQAITATERNFESASNEAIIDGSLNLLDYETVVWILGDEGTSNVTFNGTEQQRVMEFLEGGGNLFLSGSEIGWDLVANGTAADKAFYSNYLKAEYVADDADELNVSAIDGSIFDNLSFGFGNVIFGAAYEENFPDEIKPAGGSTSLLTYNNSGTTAAIHYEGLFGNSATPGSIIYLAFPFETIEQESVRKSLIGLALNSFYGILNVTTPIGLPKSIVLHQNYPNPFNPSTTIIFELPNAEQISLIIYDLLGREIIKLISDEKMQGIIRKEWNGRDSTNKLVSSGIYIATLYTGTHKFSKKMTLLK